MVHWRLQLDEDLQHDLYSLLFNGAKWSGRDVGTKELWPGTVLFIFDTHISRSIHDVVNEFQGSIALHRL